MTTIETTTTTVEPPRADFVIDDAQFAAVAFLARYTGRTFDAYATICAGSSSGRPTGPILRRRDGERLDRRTAHRWGSLHRQARRPRRRAPAHASSCVHHGRARRWRSAP
jgi:hypothetical protein